MSFNMRMKIITSTIFFLIVLVSNAVYAHNGDAGSPKQSATLSGKWEARREALYKDLGLTADQKKLLEENKNKHRGEMKALFQQMREKMAELRQELQNSTLNMEKATQINNELKNIQAQVLDHKLEGILSVRNILTPEQFKKFMAKTEDWHGRHKDKIK